MAQDFSIVLVRPRGFCAGVERAIRILETALESFPAPIYVRKEIVHNRTIVEDFRCQGVIFVEELGEVPDGATCIFSAHGVAPSVWKQAEARGLQIVDATCPLVTKVHREVLRAREAGKTILLIGHRDHDEVLGTVGHAPGHVIVVETEEGVAELDVPDPTQLFYVTQTTISMDDSIRIIDALRRRFPDLEGPRKADICYATQNRQDAVKALVAEEKIDLLIVVGSANSSNSRRLVDVAASLSVAGHLVDSADQMDPAWLDGVQRVGVSAGASAPESVVQEVVEQLQQWGGVAEEKVVIEENIHFPLPKMPPRP